MFHREHFRLGMRQQLTSLGGGMASKTRRQHPTRKTLIDTVIELLETTSPEDIRVEQVLTPSGTSVGSLYHHFNDLADLIDRAMITRYTADIDVSIAAITEVVQGATDRQSLLEGFRQNTARTQGPQRGSHRFYRAQTMTRAVVNERFREALASEQKRLTDAIADMWRELQDRGFFDPDLDPRVGSVFIQAYSLGLIVNDVSSEPIDPDAYVAFISRMLERTFLAE